MDIECGNCRAKVWYLERGRVDADSLEPAFSICCIKGNITLPKMRQPPVLLRKLFNGVHRKSCIFLDNIRSYNNMFSFTSLGGQIVSNTSGNGGPPHHSQASKFAQLYIYDTQNEISNRMSHFR
jgi:hypothetical protein